MTFSRTIVPRLPRISLTTSLSFMSTTSTISPFVALADADHPVLRLRAGRPCRPAPPGMNLLTTV